MKRLALLSRKTAARGRESKLPAGWKETGVEGGGGSGGAWQGGNPNPNGERQTRPLLVSSKNSVSLSRPPAPVRLPLPGFSHHP